MVAQVRMLCHHFVIHQACMHLVSRKTLILEWACLRERADRIVRLDTTSILVIYGNAGIVIADVRDDCIEQQPRIVRLQESGCCSLDEGIETARIVDVIIRIGILIERSILSRFSAAQRIQDQNLHS